MVLFLFVPIVLGAILILLGFTPFGIVAGSIAALLQSIIFTIFPVFRFAFSGVQSFAAKFFARALGLPGLTLGVIFILALRNGYIWS